MRRETSQFRGLQMDSHKTPIWVQAPSLFWHIVIVTVSNAKQEFKIRYHLWATSEFEREINELFPNLRSFRTGSAWKTYQFMQQLDRDNQLTLARGLVKRFDPSAINALGESLSSDEESLCSQLDEFRGIPSDLEVEIGARRRAGETIRFVSKRKLLKAMEAKFQNAFDGQCTESKRVLEGDPSLRFQMKCCGWILQTSFWFGRRESLISYSHAIAKEARIQHPDNPETAAPAILLGSGISLCSWLGITSQTEWEYLMDEDVEPTCDVIIKLCRHFFEVAPKLLKGFEDERLVG